MCRKIARALINGTYTFRLLHPLRKGKGTILTPEAVFATAIVAATFGATISVEFVCCYIITHIFHLLYYNRWVPMP